MKYSDEDLMNYAIEAKEQAYAPYSNFHVGAAVLTEDGRIFTGSNIENSSYPATICAERVAIGSAVHFGARSINTIAIAGDSDYTHPCGICRQFMIEFSNKNTKILVGKNAKEFKSYTMKDLLPFAFTKEDIGEENV